MRYILLIFVVTCVHTSSSLWNNKASLKPISFCCDTPELGDPKHLTECSNPKVSETCKDIQCIFDKSGFLVNETTLNKDAYRTYLRQWADSNTVWKDAIETAIKDCVDKDLSQYFDVPCHVFFCTGIAFVAKCPNDAWKC